MIYTLSLNASLDYDMSVDDFRQGELNLAKTTGFRAAGKGINVSRALRNMGIPAKALGFLGGFTGRYIQDALEEEGLCHDFIPLEGCTRINIKLHQGDLETEITGIAPPVPEAAFDALQNRLSALKTGDTMIFSGSIPPSLPRDAYRMLAGLLPFGAQTVLDTRGNMLQENLARNFLVKPNIGELREMTGKALLTDNDIVEACGFLLDKGIENIIVSKGGDGAVLIRRDACLTALLPPGKPVNTIGAGDSMVAGFMAGVYRGENPAECFQRAVAAGCATAYFQDICTERAMEALLPQTGVKAL